MCGLRRAQEVITSLRPSPWTSQSSYCASDCDALAVICVIQLDTHSYPTDGFRVRMIGVYGETQHYANLRVFRVDRLAAESDGLDNVAFVRLWLGRMASHPEPESGYSRYCLSTSAKALNPDFPQEHWGWGQII